MVLRSPLDVQMSGERHAMLLCTMAGLHLGMRVSGRLTERRKRQNSFGYPRIVRGFVGSMSMVDVELKIVDSSINC